jgi:hypothetical protein
MKRGHDFVGSTMSRSARYHLAGCTVHRRSRASAHPRLTGSASPRGGPSQSACVAFFRKITLPHYLDPFIEVARLICRAEPPSWLAEASKVSAVSERGRSVIIWSQGIRRHRRWPGRRYRRPMKVPPHPSPSSLIWSLTMWADCVEGNASFASIGTLLVGWVFFKVISVAPPERQTDTFPVSQSTSAFLAE